MEFDINGLNDNSLIMQWNTDTNGNPTSIHITNEIQQISTTHYLIQLAQIPDEYYRVKFVAEMINGYLIEVKDMRELVNINNFYVDYNHGIVYFHKDLAGRLVRADYYGRGVVFLSDARIFHKMGDSFATTIDDVLEKSKDGIKLLESVGGLSQAIDLLEAKADEGNAVVDRLEDFISETEFYGYTIILTREAFVVKAKEDGRLYDNELDDVYADVVVYKGAKPLTAPDLQLRIYSTTNCGCEIDSDNQRIKVTNIDTNTTKATAIIEIDCGDGLIAQRTLEVTKVFDGVSQFNVEMTNSFYSFSATHSGKIEEEQSVTCEFTVTRANEDYTGYIVGVQNMPSGILCNINQPTENASSVTFVANTGSSLPDNGSISIVFQMSDDITITKNFVFSKTKQGLSAKTLMLAGNQIIHYENADYSGIPTPMRTSITAQVTDLSGTPTWSYLEEEEWVVIDGQNGNNLILYHNNPIWGSKRELTIKCELDGMSDEITLIKVANGATGLSAYSALLSNEATTLRVNTDGTIPTEEVEAQYTRITAFKGSQQITPTSISVIVGENYKVEISGATVQLKEVDPSKTTVNIPIEIILDNAVKITKIWSIAKTEPGEHGAPGAIYTLNVEGGTRAITYNQLNENPRPSYSTMFTANLYENGNDVTANVISWYWSCSGHMLGTSIERTFIPIIQEDFDESVGNNSITVTAIYNNTPISHTIPIVVAKDVSGLDWVTDWDSSKVLVRDTEVLTPKLFAGTYDEKNDSITGVAIGTDVLNDGQVQGITAWQDNEVTFLLGTDGSLLVGNPFDEDGSGLSYNDGKFVLNVDDMSIAGATVPTWDDIEEEVSNQNKALLDAIQANIDDMNNSLDEISTYVDNIMADEVVSEIEKAQLDSLFQIVQQEVIGIQGQYTSVINNPYLPDDEIRNLEVSYARYLDAYDNIVQIYNDIFGEVPIPQINETLPEEEYLESEDFSIEAIDEVDIDDILDDEYLESEDFSIEAVDAVNEVSLDTLITKDGYFIVTKDGETISMVTENTLLDFRDAVDVLRSYSSILQQAIAEALLSISEHRAEMLVEEAKEEVIKEVSDVNSALNNLEATMNGEFKSGLIGLQSRAILEERLKQLNIEKNDVDGQYEVLNANSILDATSKNKLGMAKTSLDMAHDLLIAKINQVIIDNLMTDSELEAINSRISEYAFYLQEYSKVAQECNVTIATNSAKLAVEAITDEDVFNKVTNYGVIQGLFLKDKKVYINSEYINTRNFKAVTDDGKETFKIDENGEVSITAKSLAITGSSNLATQDYVNTQIENITNTNIVFTLSNEFQIIPTDESYYPLKEGTYSINVQGYLGSSEETTNFTIGSVSSSNGIIAIVSNVNKTVVFSVSPDTPLSDSSGFIDIPITYGNRTYNKRWSWAVSKQGNQATYVTITGEQFFKYTNNYTGTPTPNTITLTANVFNSTEVGKWQYYDKLNTSWVDCNITSKTLTLSPTDFTLSTLKHILVRYYVDSVFDTYTVACISDGGNGNDACTILLTNENHTFVANHLGVVTEQIIYTDVIAYEGTTPVTPIIGDLPLVAGLTLAKSGTRITIKADTGSSLADNGSFNIPITVNNTSFTKMFSWSKIKDGEKGDNAKSVNIIASNMIFKSTDGGEVFSPEDISLTAQYQNLTHSKWQYSIDGGVAWKDVYNDGKWQGGITASSNGLKIIIPKDCSFFTDLTTSIVFKVLSTDSSFYDVITITKLYDITNVDFEGIAQDKVDELDKRLNQQAVFDRLTNNGTSQGMFLENGELYINGEYIEANTIRVDQLEVGSITNFVGEQVYFGIMATPVGGTNLIPNSNFDDEGERFNHWATHSTYSYNPNGYIQYNQTSLTEAKNYHMPCDAIYLDESIKQVTFSVDVKVQDTSLFPTTNHNIAYIRFFDNTTSTSQADSLAYKNIKIPNDYVNDTWTREKVTVDVPSPCYVRVSPCILQNGVVCWRKFKLETGIMATGWSVCPQDTYTTSDVDVLMEQTKDSIELSVSSKYSTKEDTASAITIAKNEINTVVSNTYVTKAGIQDEIEGIYYGNRNLLRYTDFSVLGFPYTDKTTYNWRKGSLEDDDNLVRSYYNCTDCYAFPDGIGGAKIVETGATSRNPSIATDGIRMEDGVEYTASAYFKVESGSPQARIQYGTDPYYNKSINLVTNIWTRLEYTFTYDASKFSNDDPLATSFYFILSGCEYVGYICGMKLEKGNEASDWSSAPEDRDANIELLKTRINTAEQKITDEAIISTVSTTFISKDAIIGGENMVVNSNFEHGLSGWSYTNSANTERWSIHSDGTLRYFDNTTTTNSYYQLFSEIPINVSTLVGSDITLSFEYKVIDKSVLGSSAIAYIRFYTEEMKDSTSQADAVAYSNSHVGNDYVNGTWVRSEQTVTVPDGAVYARVAAYCAAQGEVYWRKYQLEVGNVSTAWKASSEDAQLYADSMTSALSTELGDLSEIVALNNGSDSITPMMKVKLVSEANDAKSIYDNLFSMYQTVGVTDFSDLVTNMVNAHTKLTSSVETMQDTITETSETGLAVILDNFNKFYEAADILNQAIINALKGITNDLSTSITQLSKSVDIQINSFNTELGAFKTNFTFSGDGLTIKSSANATKYIKLDNDSLDFMDNNTMVAQISDQQLTITNAEIDNQMKIGNIKIKPSGIGGIIFVFE